MKKFAALTALLLTATLALAGGMTWFCGIGMSNSHFEDGGSSVVRGRVGEHFTSTIGYGSIGWAHPQRSGSVTIEKPAVVTPIFTYFLHGGDSPRQSGLSFDESTGTFSGVPTMAGRWEFYPAVRDPGIPIYTGNGYWMGTHTTTDQYGDEWYTTNNPFVLVISQ